MPDEPEDGRPGPEGGGNLEDPDTPLHGWIDPADRIWRHPSELGGGAGAVPMVLNPPHHHPYRNTAMTLVGVAAAMAAVAWIAVLLSPASDRPENLSSAKLAVNGSITTLAGVENAVPPAAAAAGRAMVELRVRTAAGQVSIMGIAVAEGGLVATVADPLSGARSITALGPDGTSLTASIVATDPASDVALVDVSEDLPVAPFADDTNLTGGSSAMVLSLVPAGGPRLALHCTPGSVTAVGTAIADGPARGMPAITSSSGVVTTASASSTTTAPATPPAAVAGQPLLDAQGAVVGMLYDPGGTTSPATFLPSNLVVGVANDLRSNSRVESGWLGISGSDAAFGAGALVDAVDPGGPAADAHILAGQVIVGVNGLPVRTMAELRARLYVLTPGNPIELSVDQPAGTRVVDVVLGKSS